MSQTETEQDLRRYAEFRGGKSMKFYCIDQDERGNWITRWGRIGTEGESKPAGSRRAAERIFQTKLEKGYRELTPMELLANLAPTEPIEPIMPVRGFEERVSRALEIAGRKLALIKRDRRVLSYDQVDKQTDEVSESCQRALHKLDGAGPDAYALLRAMRIASRA